MNINWKSFIPSFLKKPTICTIAQTRSISRRSFLKWAALLTLTPVVCTIETVEAKGRGSRRGAGCSRDNRSTSASRRPDEIISEKDEELWQKKGGEGNEAQDRNAKKIEKGEKLNEMANKIKEQITTINSINDKDTTSETIGSIGKAIDNIENFWNIFSPEEKKEIASQIVLNVAILKIQGMIYDLNEELKRTDNPEEKALIDSKIAKLKVLKKRLKKISQEISNSIK